MLSRFNYIEPLSETEAIDNYLTYKVVSLEASVAPLHHIVDNVEHYAAESKLSCKAPAENLDQDESAAIFLYTMGTDFYKKLNDALRRNEMEELRPWFLYLKLFHTALNKLPCQKLRVWRGIGGLLSCTYTKDRQITWMAVSSASKDLHVLQSFLPKSGNRTIFSIECEYGKEVMKHSAFPNENEIILMPGTKLIVKSVLETPPVTIIMVKEMVNANFTNTIERLPAIKPTVRTEPLAMVQSKVTYDLIKKPALIPPIKSKIPNKNAAENCK